MFWNNMDRNNDLITNLNTRTPLKVNLMYTHIMGIQEICFTHIHIHARTYAHTHTCQAYFE